MKLFIWRHNRKHHSWSMLQEPCVHQAFYNDAIAMAIANSPEEALDLLSAENAGWLVEDLRKLAPKVIELHHPAVVFQDVRGD